MPLPSDGLTIRVCTKGLQLPCSTALDLSQDSQQCANTVDHTEGWQLYFLPV